MAWGKHFPKKQSCETCLLVKQTRSSSHGFVANAEAFVVHDNICGPLRRPTYGKKVYFLTMTSLPDRYTNTKLLILRYEAPLLCLIHIAWIVAQSGKKVLRFHSDSAMEVLIMSVVLQKLGVVLPTTSLHTPGSNGLSEKTNRVL